MKPGYKKCEPYFWMSFVSALALGPLFFLQLSDNVSSDGFLKMLNPLLNVCSVEGSTHSLLSLPELPSSAATEFLFQKMWMWQAVYHAVEKDLHPSLDLIQCHDLIVGLQALRS